MNLKRTAMRNLVKKLDCVSERYCRYLVGQINEILIDHIKNKDYINIRGFGKFRYKKHGGFWGWSIHDKDYIYKPKYTYVDFKYDQDTFN